MSRHTLRFASYKRPNDIFTAIKNGQKTLETRPISQNVKFIDGDELVLISLDTNERLIKSVKRVTEYNSIEQMAANEAVEKIMPGVKSESEIIAVFEEFKKKWGRNYTRKLEENGIVVLEIM